MLSGLAFTAFLLSVPGAPVLDCADLPGLLESFQRIHYAGRKITDSATTRSVEEFIRLIDPSRTLLLESDVESLRRELPAVFKSMRFGSCVILDRAAKLAIRRVEEDERFVARLLGGKAFKLDQRVELVLDPKRRGYPKTAVERRALLEKLVHFQVANVLLAGSDMQTAKKRILHRYELATKRQREYLSASELPALYAQAYSAALDPHSTFFTARALADFQIHMRLSLEGIGAVLRSEDGFTVIQSLVPGGQADQQGLLRPQDKVMAVAQDGEAPVDVIDMALRDVVELIRGKKGTKVTLSILREGRATETFQVTIVRDRVDVKEQAAKITYQTRTPGCPDAAEDPKGVASAPASTGSSAAAPPAAPSKSPAPAAPSAQGSAAERVACRSDARPLKIGVIDLPSFYGGDERGRSSYRDVRQLLEEAVAERVDGIVLDLSKNGGGLLKDAVNISGLFVRSGAIVATKSFDGEVEVLEDEDEAVVYPGPLLILTSPMSASGAEILAGALRDYDRAVIVGGEHTFGKGTVQVLNTLPSGVGAIKVTTGMFFLPSGRSTQKLGVASDIRVPSFLNRADIGEKELPYSLKPESIRPFLSGSVNAVESAHRWTRVDRAMVDSLTARSALRVDSDEVLQRIARELKEEEAKRGVVRLSEMMQDPKSKRDPDGTKEESEVMERAFLDEGINILVDLVGLIRERNMPLAAPTGTAPSRTN